MGQIQCLFVYIFRAVCRSSISFHSPLAFQFISLILLAIVNFVYSALAIKVFQILQSSLFLLIALLLLIYLFLIQIADLYWNQCLQIIFDAISSNNFKKLIDCLLCVDLNYQLSDIFKFYHLYTVSVVLELFHILNSWQKLFSTVSILRPSYQIYLSCAFYTFNASEALWQNF